MARRAWGSSERLPDLWSFGAARCGTLAHRAGQPSPAAPIGPGRTFRQCRGLERERFSRCDNSGPISRRVDLRFFSWSLGRVPDSDADVGGGIAVYDTNQTADESAISRGCEPDHRVSRISLHLAAEIDSGFDLAGHVRSVTWWSGGPAAGLCASNPQDWPMGPGVAAERAWSRRDRDGDPAGSSSAAW